MHSQSASIYNECLPDSWWNFKVVIVLDGQWFCLCSVKHVMVTSFLLVCGAMTVTWISDTISQSGFGTVPYC